MGKISQDELMELIGPQLLPDEHILGTMQGKPIPVIALAMLFFAAVIMVSPSHDLLSLSFDYVLVAVFLITLLTVDKQFRIATNKHIFLIRPHFFYFGKFIIRIVATASDTTYDDNLKGCINSQLDPTEWLDWISDWKRRKRFWVVTNKHVFYVANLSRDAKHPEYLIRKFMRYEIRPITES